MNNPNNQNFLRCPAFNLTEQDVAEYLTNFEQRQDRGQGPPCKYPWFRTQIVTCFLCDFLNRNWNLLFASLCWLAPNARVYFNPAPYQSAHPWAMYYSPPPFMSKPSYPVPPPNIPSNTNINNMMTSQVPTGTPVREERRPSAFLAMPPPSRSDSFSLPSTPTTTTTSTTSTDDSATESRSPNQTIFRNLFHTINCKLDKEGFEGHRIFVVETVGYSGNAKRFKKKPEKGEQALFLNCTLSDAEGKPIAQCLACHDYFDTQKYFKANPECMGKVVLIKNNAPIVVEHGEFKLLVKIMCCCAHHNMDAFYFSMTLSDPETSQVVLSCNVRICVKQWRKSNQKKDDAFVVLSWVHLNQFCGCVL